MTVQDVQTVIADVMKDIAKKMKGTPEGAPISKPQPDCTMRDAGKERQNG